MALHALESQDICHLMAGISFHAGWEIYGSSIPICSIIHFCHRRCDMINCSDIAGLPTFTHLRISFISFQFLDFSCICARRVTLYFLLAYIRAFPLLKRTNYMNTTALKARRIELSDTLLLREKRFFIQSLKRTLLINLSSFLSPVCMCVCSSYFYTLGGLKSS